MFLSAVWTLILTAPIHCKGCIAEQVYVIYPNLMKKQTHLHFGWIEGEDTFGWTIILIQFNTFFTAVSFWINHLGNAAPSLSDLLQCIHGKQNKPLLCTFECNRCLFLRSTKFCDLTSRAALIIASSTKFIHFQIFFFLHFNLWEKDAKEARQYGNKDLKDPVWEQRCDLALETDACLQTH